MFACLLSFFLTFKKWCGCLHCMFLSRCATFRPIELSLEFWFRNVCVLLLRIYDVKLASCSYAKTNRFGLRLDRLYKALRSRSPEDLETFQLAANGSSTVQVLCCHLINRFINRLIHISLNVSLIVSSISDSIIIDVSESSHAIIVLEAMSCNKFGCHYLMIGKDRKRWIGHHGDVFSSL